MGMRYMPGHFNRSIGTLAIIAVFFLAAIAMLPAAHAQGQPASVTEVIKEEKVRLDIGDAVHVTRTLVIGNVLDKPIVPGVLTLSLQKGSHNSLGPFPIPGDGTVIPLGVSDVSARMGDGTPINVTVGRVNDSTVIQYGVWVPIEPGGTVTVVLEYDSPGMVEKGIFFNKVVCPINASSIPVERAVLEASVDGHLTYASEPPTTVGGVYVWQKENLSSQQWDVYLEYSVLPLPVLPVDGIIVFWGALAVLCLAFTMLVYLWPK